MKKENEILALMQVISAFFPQFEEENEQGMIEQAREVQQESTTPPASPTSTIHGTSSASTSSSGSSK